MAWSDVLATIALKVPWERFVFRPRDHARAVEQFMAPMSAVGEQSNPDQNPAEMASQGVPEAFTRYKAVAYDTQSIRSSSVQPVSNSGPQVQIVCLFPNKTPKTDTFLALSSVCNTGQERRRGKGMGGLDWPNPID